MTDYFNNSQTVEEIKILYRQLAMEHHPDKGGDAEVMKEVNRQYHEALKTCEGQAAGYAGKAYTYMPEVERELQEKLLELLKLRSLDIALIGYWIWVSGDTKPNREALKAAGLLWHSKRKMWYYKPVGWKKSRMSNGNLDELGKKYGYRGFQTAKEEKMPTVR